MVEKLDSIGYGFFIPIFFVMVGVNLEVWSIFKEPSSMLMIPILIVGLFISKLLPSLVLRKWYPRNIVLGSAILLTSTLSLVIAAAQIGENWRSSVQVYLPLILSAVITCIFAPILFKKCSQSRNTKTKSSYYWREQNYPSVITRFKTRRL